MKGNSELIFDELIDYTSIQDLITQERMEGLYLEFKQKEKADNITLDEDDKKNFSESLSQFANSDGGVVVWGIATVHKNKIPIDKAARPVPIQQVNEFHAKLLSFMKDAVSPMVDNVSFRVITDDSNESAGYLIIHIPASDKTPHRAQYGKSREYLKRSQQGKYKLEHFDLEDMFGRRQKPKVEIIINGPTSITGINNQRKFSFALVNNGRNIARYSGFIIAFPKDITIINTAHPLRNLSQLNSHPVLSYEDNVGVIHPNGIPTYTGEVTLEIKDPTKVSLEVEISYYCESMMPKTETRALNW